MECSEQVVGEAIGLIEHDAVDVAVRIHSDEATDREGIADEPFDAEAPQLGQLCGQPFARPDQDVVRQRVEHHHHLLGAEAFLVALGNPQALLVIFERGLDPTAALFIESE